MFRAETCCRVDLAGGTLDIWPLGLLFPGAATVNVAIDVPVVVEMEERPAGYRLETDRGSFEAPDAGALLTHPDGGLLGVLVDHLSLPPVRVRLSSGSPRGGGLGASSAMTVALIRAAEALLGHTFGEVAATAALARDLEARLMRLPTGTQDHYPPLVGGALHIGYAPGRTEVTPLDVDLEGLGQHLIVVYSGQSHFSAATNWEIIRGCLESDPEIRGLFTGIAEVASELPEPLERGDWEQVGRLVGREWSLRRHLADGVSVPSVDSLLQMASSLGAWGGKACGAGGGGCVAILAPPERRAVIESSLTAADGVVLSTRPTARGLELTEE